MNKPSELGICPKCHSQAKLKDIVHGQLTFGESNQKNEQMWQCPTCRFWWAKDPS